MLTSDLIIIGSGPGGYRAAEYAARCGLSVTIVENKHAGGTCLNTGCIPTKALAHDAELGKRSWTEAVRRKNDVVSQLVNGVETLLAQPGITLVKGEARFKDPHTIAVNETLYTARNVIIATGSQPAIPPVTGIQDKTVITSEQLLSLQQLPQSLCIIGAGVIGMEFASILNRFGCKITIVEFLNECLATMDADIAKRVRRLMERRGIDFHLQCSVSRIAGHQVFFKDKKGNEQCIEADRILLATGRCPNLSNLGLEAIGINYGRKGITVDDNMLTNIPHIYAIGDCNGRQMLAHAATFQGFRAINHLLGKADHINLKVMPAAVFTLPEVAGVGVTTQTGRAGGTGFHERKGFYRANGRALAMEADEGMVKLITNDEDVIVGCHAYGPHAADIIQEAACLMNVKATRAQLADMVHIHPTIAEVLQDMAR